MPAGYVYILGGKTLALYVGVTSNLPRRLHEHRSKSIDGHTARYNITRLLYAEAHDTMESAIGREKQIKRWRRDKKLALVRSANPNLRDLADDFLGA